MWCKSGTEKKGMRWWEMMPIIVGPPIVALLLWLWLRRRTEEKAAPTVRIKISPRPRLTEKEKTMPLGDATPPVPDDLKRIEGIGPKTSSALQAADVTTFAQLAATGVDQLKDILREAGIRTNPSTWPEQASIAADGEWDALEALQAELKGGRRV